MEKKSKKKTEQEPKQFDLSKEWEMTKKHLRVFSKEAVELAKKGEKELIKFSKIGKLHVDNTAVSIKKEKLYYQIGKEYVKSKGEPQKNEELKKLVDALKNLDKEQTVIKSRIKKGQPESPAPDKKTSTKKKTIKKKTVKKKVVDSE
ncbi:MAG: hypothetical protein K8S27_01920 [Candidatus Omnitrophica bacterium]|nr:hypothetical protein [Candidatus Omnitrophota bacterium]